MSVRQDKSQASAAAPLFEAQATEGLAEPLGEGNSFAVAHADNPLKRIIAVSIKASLNDLCLQKSRGTWAPSQEALRSIFQQVSRNPGRCPLPECHTNPIKRNPIKRNPIKRNPPKRNRLTLVCNPVHPLHIARLPTDRPCACPLAFYFKFG
jgi:hypothetical protein